MSRDSVERRWRANRLTHDLRAILGGYVGPVGAVVASLCCFGTPVLVAAFTSLGLGVFLIDLILLPLLVVFLGLTVYGSYVRRTRHQKTYPLALIAILAVLLIPAIFISTAMAYTALIGLVGVVLTDSRLIHRVSVQ